MRTVLLPVKDFTNAKHRLIPALSPDERAGLAKAMLRDVLEAISQADVERVVVYTASESVRRVVQPFGFEIIHEHAVEGHSAAVNYMIPILASTSARLLIIASDLPTLTAQDIDEAFNFPCDSIAILPSRDSTETNGMLFLCPASIELAYGEGSFARHVERIRNAGHRATVLQIGGIAFDIDTPEDLETFLEDPRLESETWRFLRNSRVSAR
jgi:2-phospho-L-lactate guanylyltransferase